MARPCVAKKRSGRPSIETREKLKRALIRDERLTREMASSNRDLEQTRHRLILAESESNSYSWPNLCRAAAQAIQYCREHHLESVALYGASNHTEQLLPVWRALNGPRVLAILVSETTDRTAFGLPVICISDPIPSEIQAVIPSSHRFESTMRQKWIAQYPEISWVRFWERDDT